MANSADFESFLKDINPSKSTIDEASRLHKSLREHLKASDTYSSVCKDTYLSGSYAKQTFIRQKKDSDGCDIDIIVETNHSVADAPYNVLQELKEAICERKCYQDAEVQTHSVGIDMTNFHLDVVPLVKDVDGLLYVGSSFDSSWKRTNPKRHISWSTDINQSFGGNYKPLVKMMKWWRRENCPSCVKFPKGITLEKMIADNLPDAELPIQDRIMQAMANLAEAYTEELSSYQVPFIEDPAVVDNNLAGKYKFDDFAQFVGKLKGHLSLLANEGTGNSTWKQILGDNFPTDSTSSNSLSRAKAIGQKVALSVRHKRKPDFSMQAPKPNASVTATATLPSGEVRELSNDGLAIPKESTVVYRVICGPIKDGMVKWQVTNTGEEAMRSCPRGNFEVPNHGKTSRSEKTAYVGKHYVQCFIVRKGYCVRWTNPFFINVE